MSAAPKFPSKVRSATGTVVRETRGSMSAVVWLRSRTTPI